MNLLLLALATQPALLDPVVLTASGAERRAFDTPISVSVLQLEDLRGAGPMLNLSESLSRLPGVQASNRHNLAQDQR